MAAFVAQVRDTSCYICLLASLILLRQQDIQVSEAEDR